MKRTACHISSGRRRHSRHGVGCYGRVSYACRRSRYSIGLQGRLHQPSDGRCGGVRPEHENGTELAVEEINAAGGIGGVPVEVIYEDDRLSPADAQTALLKLVETDQVQ